MTVASLWRLAAWSAESACLTAFATAGDNWSCSTALGVKTGEELDKFVGAALGSRGAVTDRGGFPSDSGTRDKPSRSAVHLAVMSSNSNTTNNN